MVVSISAAVERLEELYARRNFDALGVASVPGPWSDYWLLVIVGAVFNGLWLWFVGGWWYRLRLNWSRDGDPDKPEARLDYFYARMKEKIK